MRIAASIAASLSFVSCVCSQNLPAVPVGTDPPKSGLNVVVHSRATAAATWSEIDNALQSVAAVGGAVVFVDAVYQVDKPFLVYKPKAPMQLVAHGAPTRPRIQYDATAPHTRYLFYIAEARHDVCVEGLEFDGSYRVAQLVRIENPGAQNDYCLGSVLVRGCVFRNGRQRIWDQGTMTGQLEDKFGHEEAAAGVYIRGAFTGVILHDSTFDDFGHVEVPEMPAVQWTAGSRGAWVTTELDPGSSTPTEFSPRPRRVDVLDCTFSNITSKRFQHVSSGALVPVDADGLHIGALASASAPYVHRAAVAVVRGSTFTACEYRSIKLQIERAIVHGNTFTRTTNGQCEIDAQHSGAQVTNNQLAVVGSRHLQGAGLIQAAYRSSAAEPFVVTGNSFQIDAGSNASAVGLGAVGAEIRDVVIAGNTVAGLGQPFAFLYVYQPEANVENAPTVVGNSLQNGFASSFVYVSLSAASPTATVGGVYADNTSSVPGMQSGTGFAPSCWTCNSGITAPP